MPRSQFHVSTQSRADDGDDEGRNYAASQARQAKGARVRKAAVAHVTAQHPSSPRVSDVTTFDPRNDSRSIAAKKGIRRSIGNRNFSIVTAGPSSKKKDARQAKSQMKSQIRNRRPFIYVNSNYPQRLVKMRCPRGREQLIERLWSKPRPGPDHSTNHLPQKVLQGVSSAQSHRSYQNLDQIESTAGSAKRRGSGYANDPIDITSDLDGENDLIPSDSECSHDVSSHRIIESMGADGSDSEFEFSRTPESLRMLAKASRKRTAASDQLDGSGGSRIPSLFPMGTSDGEKMSATCRDHVATKTALPCASTMDEPDSSEDSDPPVKFSRRRRIALRLGGRNRSKDSKIRFSDVSSINSEGAEIQSSEFVAPLVLPWENVDPASSVSSRVHDSAIAPSNTKAERERVRRGSELPTKPVAELSHATATLSRNVLGDNHVMKHPVAENGEPVMSGEAEAPVLCPGVKDEQQDCLQSHAMDEDEQPDPNRRSATAPLTYKKSTFGIKDIVGKGELPRGRVFSLSDVVPKKESKPVNASVCTQNLRIFHDALRACFPPAVIGPDYIQHGPVKIKEFTFADVTKTATRDPLFSVEYAVEQHKIHRSKADEASDLDRGFPQLESKASSMNSDSDEDMDSELLEDNCLPTPSETGHHSVISAPGNQKSVFLEGKGEENLVVQEDIEAGKFLSDSHCC